RCRRSERPHRGRALAVRRRGAHARGRGLSRIGRRGGRRDRAGRRGRPAGDAVGRRHGGERRHAGGPRRARAGTSPAEPAPAAPGDLPAPGGAGITGAASRTRPRARGQWVSLDPADARVATLGGVLATNASGPRRHLYGPVRDLLIGLTVVTADGAIVRGGGK